MELLVVFSITIFHKSFLSRWQKTRVFAFIWRGVEERLGGEKVRKVTVAVLAFALLILCTTVAPALAKAEKVPVAGLSITTGGGPTDDFKTWDTKGGIDQVRGVIVTSISKYWVGVTSVPNPAVNPTYVFAVTTILSPGMENTKTDRAISLWKSTMSYPAVGQVLGTFEGVMHVESDGGITTVHCVYQGTGMFEGQTLMMSGLRTGSAPGVIEGFLLTH